MQLRKCLNGLCTEIALPTFTSPPSSSFAAPWQPTNHNRFVVNAKLIINPLAASSVRDLCRVIAIVTGPDTKCDSLDEEGSGAW